jgi:hypothetical protein
MCRSAHSAPFTLASTVWLTHSTPRGLLAPRGMVVILLSYAQAIRRVVCFGGLASYRTLPDGTGFLSCAIITRDAAPSVRAVYDRMPVILQESQFAKWLDPNVVL